MADPRELTEAQAAAGLTPEHADLINALVAARSPAVATIPPDVQQAATGATPTSMSPLVALAHFLGQALMMRGGVGMPGGIARPRDIRANFPLQVSQGRASVVAPGTHVPGTLLPYTEGSSAQQLLRPSRMGDAPVVGPLAQTYKPGGGASFAWTPAHEREGLWDQMLEYLIGTSRQ